MITAITHEHLARIADIHLRAFPTSALNLLGREAVRRYYEWQLVGPHDSVAVGVQHGGLLVGYCFGGLFHGSIAGFVKRNAIFLGLRAMAHPAAVIDARFRQRAVMGLRAATKRRRPPAPATIRPGTNAGSSGKPFGILAIAVDPDAGRSGIGRALMDHMESVALERGFSHMRLTVSPENVTAVRFYEKLGWTRVPGPDGWKGRMAKSLGEVALL